MREIPLAAGKGVVFVDDADYESLIGSRWELNSGRYALRICRTVRSGGAGRVYEYMHRVILAAPADMKVDHIDGNGLNNTRANMRCCTNAQNLANSRKALGTSSRYKGVSWAKNMRRWHAYITVQYKRTSLGHFDDEVAAAYAYDAAARIAFGTFARLNFPNTGEQPARAA